MPIELLDNYEQEIDYARSRSIEKMLKNPTSCCSFSPPLVKLSKSKAKLYLTIIFLICSDFVSSFVIAPTVNNLSFYILNLTFLILLIFVFILSCMNPGFPDKSQYTTLDLLQKIPSSDICGNCNILRPPRSKHCSICNKCIQRYDHHCPWINNCVGIRNHFIFIIFIAILYLNILHVVAICFLFFFDFELKNISCKMNLTISCLFPYLLGMGKINDLVTLLMGMIGTFFMIGISSFNIEFYYLYK